MSRRRAGLWGLLVVLALVPSPANAASATGHELADLAGRAASGDAAALARLRTIDSVDGRPVNVARALPASVTEPGAPERLRTLARGVSAGGSTAGSNAAADARNVLADDRFGVHHGAGPLYGVAHAIGRFLSWLASPLRALGDLWWVPLALLLLVAVAALASSIAERSRRLIADHRVGERDARALVDPAALEREADEAERAGDHARALRLRFEAGLVRLDRAGAIRLRSSTTSGAVRSTLGQSSFDPLADAHDDVVYGSRAADDRDLAAARETWPRLLDEVSRR